MFILVGPSASGKTTISDRLVEELGMRRVVTTTTRRRRKGESLDAYHFITSGEFDTSEMVEHVVYSGNRYGTSKQEVDSSNLAILEPQGAIAVCRYCQHKLRDCRIIGLSVSVKQQAERMVHRGDSAKDIDARIKNDRKAFSGFEAICHIVVPTTELEETYQRIRQYILER